MAPIAEIDLHAADRCVKCGLCLPHCPTYRISRDEGEGPRGRIALMQAVGRGQLAADETALGWHLDGCLDCRSCERVCPAGVPYGRLLDQARAVLRTREGPSPRLLRRLVRSPALTRAAARALRLSDALGMAALARRGVFGRRLARLARRHLPIPAVTVPRDGPPSSGRTRATMGLFTGCIPGALDGESLRSVSRLAHALDLELHVPRGQGCCGALHMHAGDDEAAEGLARANLHAFRASGVAEVMNLSSGCGAHLHDYPALFGDADTPRFVDALDVLVRQGLTERLRFRPMTARALLHVPCTQRNVLGTQDATRQALEAIPGLSLEWPGGTPGCCGAAGSYFISEPERSDAVLAGTLERLPERLADYLLSPNLGCALQIGGELRARGHDIEVLHPVTLLARQLER